MLENTYMDKMDTSILQFNNGFVPHYTNNHVFHALRRISLPRYTYDWQEQSQIDTKQTPFNDKHKRLVLSVVNFVAAICWPWVFHGWKVVYVTQ